MPVGAVAVGIDMAEVIPSSHVLGACAGHGGEVGIVYEHFAPLFGMSPQKSGHFLLSDRSSIACYGARRDHGVVRSAAGIEDMARDETDQDEAQLDDFQDGLSALVREVIVLKNLGESILSFTPRGSLLAYLNEDSSTNRAGDGTGDGSFRSGDSDRAGDRSGR